MAFDATPEQKLAINTEGNILVAAAAGSGKTAVLVERVIKKLCSKENGVSADKLLIVTFTNAAAAEMRSRIEKRLDEECRKSPENTALRLQRYLLASAKICTIDSFCIDLVRENFSLCEVSPDFKLSDASTLEKINKNIALNLFNEYLEIGNRSFLDLLDIIGTEYDQNSFLEFVLSVYDYSRQLPFPKDWFKSLPEYYKGKFKKGNPWWDYAFNKARRYLSDSLEALVSAKELLEVNEAANSGYNSAFCEALTVLNNLYSVAENDDWNSLFSELCQFKMPALPIVKGVKDIFEISAALNIYKNQIPKKIESLKRIFYSNLELINAQFEFIYEPICILSDILCELDDRIFAEYKAENSFTFHNTEHLALNLLCKKGMGNEILINDKAAELLDRFEEVCVDEYQDTNDLQDMLFYVLSNREKKLFVVGDIKQSIYGFRGANPKNFAEKKNRYIPIERASDKMAQKIILGNNFRSRPEICHFINFFFSLFMNRLTGDLVYNNEEMLIPSAKYPEISSVKTEVNFVDCAGSDSSSLEAEAKLIAEKIKGIMAEGECIRKTESTLRNAEFSDFAILLRSAKANAPTIMKILKEQGIPVSYSDESVELNSEIAMLLSLLTVIDNPNSDIELLTLLMSPIFGFNSEELAKIRITKRKGSLYSAVLACEDNEKVAYFLEKMDYFRLLSTINPLPAFLNILYDETGILNIASSLSDGINRRNNLISVLDYAENYFKEGRDSLGGFIKYLKHGLEKGLKSGGKLSGNSVKIMSIHASKGLQFPVTFISNISSRFNDSEAKEGGIYTTDFGIGFKYFDERAKEKYTTVAREVILSKIRSEKAEEELRLLYVAMTRAEDRLIFTGSLNNAEKKTDSIKSLMISAQCIINSGVITAAKSYGEWLLCALLLHPDCETLRDGCSIIPRQTESRVKINIISAETLLKADAVYEENSKNPDLKLARAISQNLQYKYPFGDILDIEAKASVTRLANSAEAQRFAFKDKPAFLNEGGITPAEKGTALHKVMEHFDFSKWQEPESEIARLYEWEFISERQAEAVSVEDIKAFFQSEVFKRILKAETVKREMRFLTEIDALKIAPYLNSDYSGEKIIVQGAVDICFIEEDGIVILDFKTDRVDNINELKESYGGQLEIYAKACEKIFLKPVKEKIIYSFNKQAEVLV